MRSTRSAVSPATHTSSLIEEQRMRVCAAWCSRHPGWKSRSRKPRSSQTWISARTALKTLQSLGIKISLDDFGVGYASLYNLRELRFDKIKIDRSFVLSMQSNPGSAKIVHSVIELAKSLGLPTIAEGIEHQEVVQQIMRSGGEYGHHAGAAEHYLKGSWLRSSRSRQLEDI